MKDENLIEKLQGLTRIVIGLFVVVLLMGLSAIYLDRWYDPKHFQFAAESTEKAPQMAANLEDQGAIVDGVHIASGLKAGEGLDLVIGNCTNCHSAKMITQNRANKEGWESMIKWMQETQNLWDLGANQDAIVTYLSTYYAPEQKGRRQPLENIEWYEIK
ncbi:MAG: hypothetical protein ACR2MX_04825 [Cyclobacteriaceae bacterium]